MKKFTKYTLMLVCAAMTMAACDDTTDSIGSSLTGSTDNLNVTADTFSVSSRTIMAEKLPSRNVTGYLGKVKDPETGAVVTGDFMTQFHLLEGYQLPDESKISSRDENGEIIADSCEIRLYYSGFFGDSLAPMKMTVYEMDKPLEENVTYYSDFDPYKEGMVRTNGLAQQRSYTMADLTEKESVRQSNDYTSNIRIKLNTPYTDKDGVTYNNYATYVMRQYYKHPEYFTSTYRFIHHVMPGFFFKNTGGEDNMVYVTTPQFNFYFRYENADTTVRASSSFAGTEEVLQTTTFTNDEQKLAELMADNSCTYLKTPAGLYTEFTLPIEEIMRGHENDTINTARFNIPRQNNQVSTPYALNIPTSLVMLPKDDVAAFFQSGKLPDYKTSFVSTYSQSTNSYLFGNISGIINEMYKRMKNGTRTADWNKVVVIPVTLQTTSSSNGTQTLVNLYTDMSLTTTRLVGGSDNPDKLKISVIYSKFGD